MAELQSKAQKIKAEMMKAIVAEQEEFKAKHVFPIERRTKSCMGYHHKYQTPIMYEPDMMDAHIHFIHPTNKYRKFVKDHAANGFQELRD